MGDVATVEGAPAVNVARIIDSHPADRVALIGRNRTTTYGELRDQVAGVRGGLVAAGIQSGDRVAIGCANGRPFVVAYLAVVGAGAIAVPLNPASPAPEMLRELTTVEPTMVVLDAHAVAGWSHIDPADVPFVDTVVATDAEVARRLEPGADAGSHRVVVLAELIDHEPAATVDVPPDTVAAMLFTSGTAGAPRAAMLTHGNLLSNIEQARSAPVHTDAGDVVYGVLPMFHIFGLNVMLGGTLSVGATLVVVQRFDPATAAESIVERGVTVLPGAPPMWVAFAHFDDLAPDTFSSVRIAGSGASRLPVSVAQRLEERFGLQVFEGYGLTEASPVVTSSVGAGDGPRYGSVGRVLSGIEIRLVNDQGSDVVAGDVGEIHVRGPNVFVGYFRDDEATARVLDDDGWLHTGDLGTVDDEGWLYLVDRAKDLIIVSGFNVFPAEVEAVLGAHPAIAEVGVVGVPHPHTGEAVKAYVALRPGHEADEDELVDFARDHLARYKCPSKVLFVDELPRNLSGKLVRRHLGDTVLDDTVPADTAVATSEA